MPLRNIGHAVTAAGADFYTAPAASAANGPNPEGVVTVMGLQVANRTASTATITVSWRDVSNANAQWDFVKDIAVPGNSSINIIDAFRHILEAGDILRAQASANNVFHITGAVSED
jgi:hypothetical protein